MRELENIWILLQPYWEKQAEKLRLEMEQDGIACVCVRDFAGILEADLCRTILLTDDTAAAGKWKQRGGVCVGCTQKDAFFEGAKLVTDNLENLDGRLLEECLLHGQGRPVTVAETERLIIREITEEDVDTLYQISMQDGMQHLMRNQAEKNPFEPDRMLAYIENVYHFYGYGLWSVWKKDGTLIGCCGVNEYEHTESRDAQSEILEISLLESNAGEQGIPESNAGEQSSAEMRLELQYMLDPAFQRQGYGFEMCQAVLNYVVTRTDWSQVWVRIFPDNLPSIKLAEKLREAVKQVGVDTVCP